MEKYSSNLLRLMGKITRIFGIPAFGGFFIGLFLDRYFGTERRYILITLSVSFVLSWVLLWRFYRRMKSAQVTQGVGSVAGMSSESGMLRYDEPGVWKSKRK